MRVIFIILVVNTIYQVHAVNPGRCRTVKPQENCIGSDQCKADEDCSGSQQKCCSNGCIKTCSPTLQSPCELQKSALEGQVRALNPEDALSIVIPKCREDDGLFEEIQCSAEKCWCVNPETGYEIYDTRVKKDEKINCKGQGKCLGPTCRMFCDYGFSLDENGCQVCNCFNPCQDVKCPGSTECQVKTVDCTTGKCSIPTCRRPRTLDSLCPVGSPLLSEGGGSPLLCGIGSFRPRCPDIGYKCNVQEGHDYGTCCPFKAKIGKCPVDYSHPTCDGENCSSDMDCFGDKKCCSSSNCGSVCAEPVNNTLCFQQKEIAEHRTSPEFIPKCSRTGEFLPMQCSNNKDLCWCVDENGGMIEKSIKVSADVKCQPHKKDDERPLSDRSSRRKKSPCKIGLPLVDKLTGRVMLCGTQSCPTTYECKKTRPNAEDSSMVCCATAESIVKTKIGECPEFIPEPRHCPREKNGTCVSDSHCPDTLHCCPSRLCGSLCSDPDIDSLPKPNQLPTTCEYLRDLKRVTGSSPIGRSLATHTPRCKKTGVWEPVQCTSEECWCVGVFGVEIANTRAKYQKDFDCRQARENDLCDIALCRLGCDYGFKKGEDGCPICECREACDDIDCGNGRKCIVRSIDCGFSQCPPVGTCEPKTENSVQTCPEGSTALSYDSAVITCDNKYFRCLENYTCQGNTEMAPGLCCSKSGSVTKEGQCPATARSVADVCVEQCQIDDDCSGPQKCCKNGCGAHTCVEPIGTETKAGQCPYILSDSNMSCDFECSSDYDCSGKQKCCSNGCGTACTVPKSLTACQHMQEIIQHRRKSSRANRLGSRVPTCTDRGEFNPVQCDNFGSICWCVDKSGEEIAGTRVGPGQAINCEEPAGCSQVECKLKCSHGFVIGDDGCPLCKCKNLCQDVPCTRTKECRVVKVQCITEPCPPVAMCRPRLKNPCSLGKPLKVQGSNDYLQCGPTKNPCPSSHACNMSPFGEYSVCCPKPKRTCDLKKSIGDCRASLPRWYFDSDTNTCQKFKYGGCGGNLNNFKSEEHCKKTCPTMSSCQVKRRKGRRLKNIFSSNFGFKPRCQDSKAGEWNNVQCMAAFGLCWCVDKKGSQLPGTLIRGTPKCSTRGGRKLDDTPICKNGEPVNVCKESLCNGLECKAFSDATCRINPCGSCKAEFYDQDGEVVDCSQGLTDCERKHQEIKNSHRYRVQVGILPFSDAEDDQNELPSATLRQQATVETGRLPAKMTISPSMCQPNGEFQPVQTQNKLSWCVDKFGETRHETLSIGKIECDETGSIISKESQSPVCPNSAIPPRICNEACINAHCPAHPDAICVSDACNNCETSFISTDGKTVNCGSKCIQPMKEGNCNNPSVRYHYNQMTKQCQEFMYNGCDGNDNNFPSEDICTVECTTPIPVCEQPVDIGICRMNDARWFYNKDTQNCEEFVFGGCHGNDNNFLTKEACQARCPDIVVCPWNSVQGKDNEIEPCSRDKACAEKKCSYPDSICTVNPCSCEPVFVDMNGQAVSCDDTQEPNYIFDGTRCSKIREEQYKTGSRFQVGCDKDGTFLPIQCNQAVADKETCWCVDESGNKLSNSTVFLRGERKCEFVPVEWIDIQLTFNHEGKLKEDQIPKLKSTVNEILSTMSAGVADDLHVKSNKNSTAVQFTLIGKNKVTTAYHLEKMIKETKFKIYVDDKVLISDYSTSKFQHRHASLPASSMEATEEDKGYSERTVALIVIFVVLGILAIFAVVAAVLIYRKRARQYSPKEQSTGLAFDSPVYGLTSS